MDSDCVSCVVFIFRIDYSDLSTALAERDSHYKAKSVYEPAACACKNLKIFGVSVHFDEFPEESRTMPQAPDYPESPPPSPRSGSCSPPLHHPHSTLEGLSLSAEQFHSSPLSGSLLPQIKIATFAGHSEIKLKLKQNVAVPGPKVLLKLMLLKKAPLLRTTLRRVVCLHDLYYTGQACMIGIEQNSLQCERKRQFL